MWTWAAVEKVGKKRTMTVIQALREIGIDVLTGEADATTMGRLLWDLSPQATIDVEEFLRGDTSIRSFSITTPPWNRPHPDGHSILASRSLMCATLVDHYQRKMGMHVEEEDEILFIEEKNASSFSSFSPHPSTPLPSLWVLEEGTPAVGIHEALASVCNAQLVGSGREVCGQLWIKGCVPFGYLRDFLGGAISLEKGNSVSVCEADVLVQVQMPLQDWEMLLALALVLRVYRDRGIVSYLHRIAPPLPSALCTTGEGQEREVDTYVFVPAGVNAQLSFPNTSLGPALAAQVIKVWMKKAEKMGRV